MEEIKMDFQILGLQIFNRMPVYNKEYFQNAYKNGAEELARKILDNAYESARYNSDCTEHVEKFFLHKTVADEVLRLLKATVVDISVVMTFKPEGDNEGMALYMIDWS
jgi:hypothetical protein